MRGRDWLLECHSQQEGGGGGCLAVCDHMLFYMGGAHIKERPATKVMWACASQPPVDCVPMQLKVSISPLTAMVKL